MRFYTKQHKYYCGIDLHARSMFMCILDQEGTTLLHRQMPSAPEAFLGAIAPYREDIVVAVECIFTWYWLADLCAREGIPFVLGHALYMKAIHGSKTKNDKIDSQKIAVLLRGGMIPMAYVYPQEMRATRDLLRRRMYLMHTRSELLVHIQNTNSQYNLPEFGKKIAYRANRTGVADSFADPHVRKTIEVDLQLLDFYDQLLTNLELHITQTAKAHDPHSFYLLRSIPGVGKILALVLLYEIHDIARFPRVQNFASYARLVRCTKESAGKRPGSGNKKIGNVHLKWAFSEAACLFLRNNEPAQRYHQRWSASTGKPKRWRSSPTSWAAPSTSCSADGRRSIRQSPCAQRECLGPAGGARRLTGPPGGTTRFGRTAVSDHPWAAATASAPVGERPESGALIGPSAGPQALAL